MGKSGLSPKQKRKLKRFMGFLNEQQSKVGRISGKSNGRRSVQQDREDNNPQRLNTHRETARNDSPNMGTL